MGKSYAEITAEINRGIVKFGQGASDAMAGLSAMARGALKAGALSELHKELIALAIGVAGHCAGCIGFHVKSLVRLGAKRDEVMEAHSCVVGLALAFGARFADVDLVRAAELTGDQVRAALAQAPPDHPADLSGKDLSDLDLSYVDFKRANLRGTSLFGTKLIKANLAGADLSRANLNGAWLMGTNFAGADLSGSSLLSPVIVGGPVNQPPSFPGANLAGARMMGDWMRADFRGANFSNAHTQWTGPTGARLTHVLVWRFTSETARSPAARE